jgi:hypothetical protein
VAQPQRAKASDWRWFEASLHISLSMIFHIGEDLSRSSFTVPLSRNQLVLQEEPAAQRHALWFHCYRFSLLSISLKSLKLAFAKATVHSLLEPSQTRQILPHSKGNVDWRGWPRGLARYEVVNGYLASAEGTRVIWLPVGLFDNTCLFLFMANLSRAQNKHLSIRRRQITTWTTYNKPISVFYLPPLLTIPFK